MSKRYDYIIVGAGIIGLGTALNLKNKDPNSKILVLEKEGELAKHQTGNNSGVIHSGIYYKPGSQKALNCRRGYELLLDNCRSNEIEFDICGKLIVAVDQTEEIRLNEIYNRGIENGLTGLKIIDSSELKEYEPNALGTRAILVPQTGVIDFALVLRKFSEIFYKNNGEIIFNSEVTDIIEKTDNVVIETKKDSFLTKRVICCAGLQSDRLARKTISNLDIRIIPFRGEYYRIRNTNKNIVQNLIYPVPDPSFPFLGVHFTKRIDGEVEAGPNAVLAFCREGYKKHDFNLKDFVEILAWKGFRKVAVKHWKTGLGEFYRSYNKKVFVKALQKLVPSIKENDLVPGGAGVRAQACDKLGNLLDDFNFQKSKRVLHVCNAPSPAATSSLAIGEKIAGMFHN